MGLDMMLYKEVYVGAQYEFKHMKVDIHIEDGAGNVLPINPNKMTKIVESFGVWRKVNAIHNWFVENVQDGVDDCGTYYVSRDNLEALLIVVLTVLENHSKAKELLPTQSGFFFGATEYDEWYYSDLEDTREIVQNALTELNNDKTHSISFSYHSSW